MIHGFMGVMYGTKVYDISIDRCLYWGMSYCMQLRFAIWWSWVYRYITAPQLRMVIPFGISKFFDVVCTL